MSKKPIQSDLTSPTPTSSLTDSIMNAAQQVNSEYLKIQGQNMRNCVELKEVKSELSLLKTDNESKKAKISTLETESKDLKEELQNMKTQFDNLTKINESLNQQTSKIHELESQLKFYKQKVKTLHAKYNKLQKSTFTCFAEIKEEFELERVIEVEDGDEGGDKEMVDIDKDSFTSDDSDSEFCVEEESTRSEDD